MDSNFAHQVQHNNIVPRYPQHINHQHHPNNNQMAASGGPFYPSIDVDALAAGVQRFLPGRPSGYPHNNSYISLPPGVDPATVDFRTFYPYNPSEVKHRKRTTRPQLKVLEDTFKRETKPNAALRKQLAAQLEMTPRGVQVWFQNRRAKEKNLAKKASSSSANGRKAINQDALKDGGDDADGDVDLDDGDVTADDDNSNYELPGRPASQAPGTESALDERKRSQSSSNSPESTSPELTPPNGSVDIQPHVSVSPPGEEDGSFGQPEAKQGGDASGLSFPPTSWQGPRRSMSRTPTLGMGMEQGHEYAEETGYDGNNMHSVPLQDQFMRRPSLPTHLGIGPSRVRSGYHCSPRASNLSFGSVNAGRTAGYDPAVRRMSLDRLASHPYAHLAAQANSVVYGPGATRFRPTLPATAHSTPTHTPQARVTDLPPISQTHIDTAQHGDANSNNGIPELSLPPQLQHPSMSPPASEVRPELMHRQSLPAHLAIPGQFPPSTTRFPPQPQSANPMSMRFPRPGHVYALSARNYQPPIEGPLPNPEFSFGSVGNGDGEGSQVDGSDTPDMQLQSSLNNFQFPAVDDGKDNSGSAGAGQGFEMEIEGDPQTTLPPGGLGSRPNVYYRDTQGLHGAADPYASRFGSIASTVSITESESSANSGACFSSEGGSNFEVQQDMIRSTGHPPTGYNDARRTSCTNSMMDMFSNLDVQNGSQSSLPHSRDPPKQNAQMPISRSSELALALMPDDDRQSSPYGCDNGSNVNVNMNDTSNAGLYSRQSLSSSDLPHGHGLHRHSLVATSRSAGSSRSSLGIHTARVPRLETDNLDFMHNYDDVSETGHYSPVSRPSPAPFEYPLTESLGNSANHTHTSRANSTHGNESVVSLEGIEQEDLMMSGTPPHHYGADSGQQQHQPPQSQFYSLSGPYGKDGSYVQPHSSSYSLQGHSQENVTGYGYYS